MAMTNIPFFPSSVGVFGIFLILCIIVYSVIGRIYTNVKRRNHYWKKFDYSRYMKNEPEKQGDDTSGRNLNSLDTQCSAAGYELPAVPDSTDQTGGTNTSATTTTTTDASAPHTHTHTHAHTDTTVGGFTNMIIPETLSRTIEPSNTQNYVNYSTLF